MKIIKGKLIIYIYGKESSFHLYVTCKTRSRQGRNEEETMAGHKET